MNEALEKLEGEEHSVGEYRAKEQKQKKEIDELSMKCEEQSENISRVCGIRYFHL